MDGWFLEQAHAPHAAVGLTAEDAARIAAEVFRRMTQAPTIRRTYRSTRQLPQASPAELHLKLMRKIHVTSERIGGPVGWRDVSQMLSKPQRNATEPDTYLAAARDLEALDAGVISFGARGAVHYCATGQFPTPIY